MQSIFSKVIIFPVFKQAGTPLKRFLLSKVDSQIQPFQGVIEPTDVSCIYTATRLFLKQTYDLHFQDTLDVIAKKGNSYWLDDMFRQWLIKFVEADFYDNYDDKTYSFILPIEKEVSEIQNENVMNVSEEEFQTLCPKDYENYLLVKNYYEEAEKSNTLSYFGILNCEVSRAWKNHYEALYSGIFRQKGERWLNFSAANFEFPSDEQLAQLKGLVISGANHEAYDESLPFHHDLYSFLQKAYTKFPQLKMLGVCFGCQVLAHCLGGKASRMEGLDVPFIADLTYVKLKKELKEKDYYKKTLELLNLDDVNDFVVVESHGDHVERLPENAVILGDSDQTRVEMWGVDNKILSVQFHPEFNESIMKYKVLEEVPFDEKTKKKMLDNFITSENERKLHRTFQINLCKNFLKSS